ncbi:hypothetical protein [Pleionea sp. CnH1-48]|uniref:hypothetical protein n=1 Tax=Pleionea sp. CnH1-48 TaxID=2954494 RepID=UPI0020983193|nr:hypothetical protein [Pleionea sp. CnH1-48]MCO7223515.1 hypothetical protein [Pleionea sp. CnH1-48]
MKELEFQISSVRWSDFSGPEHYKPDELVEALIDLSRYDESRAINGLENKVLFAVGNNHAGTYYPAVLVALDILIVIEQSSEVEAIRNCAHAILNNLYYFSPEVGDYMAHSPQEIEDYVKVKLKPYSDNPES